MNLPITRSDSVDLVALEIKPLKRWFFLFACKDHGNAFIMNRFCLIFSRRFGTIIAPYKNTHITEQSTVSLNRVATRIDSDGGIKIK